VGKLSQAYKYLRYHFQSKRWDAFHSPFLFQLFEYACDDEIQYPLFERIEHERSLFRNSNEEIIRTDLGAGSKINPSTRTTISAVARASLSIPFQCRFMSRLVSWTASKTIVEFGTSLGISTAYLAAGSLTGKIISVEGDPATANQAEKLLNNLAVKNVMVCKQRFEDFINDTLPTIGSIDLAFIDGNHEKNSLLKYFQALKPFIHKHSIIIVDDIYWSDEMQSAWQELIMDPEITQSVECFHFGLLFFKPEFLNKENHRIHFTLEAQLK
jgi:predicted O-methyltransferase YrrM